MRVILYARPGQGAGASALASAPAALAVGCAALGHSVLWRRPGVFTPDQMEPCDAVGVVGLQGGQGVVARAYAARGVPVVIADLPRLRHVAGTVGLYRDSLQWMPAAGDPVRGATMDPGVLAEREPRTILVCQQLPGDAAHGMDARACAAWTADTVARIAAVTDGKSMPVVVRPHPITAAAEGAPLPPLRDALATAAAVVTYNSGAGLEALLAGVPVVADPSACYAPWTVPLASLGDPRPIPAAARADLLARVALTQWTLAEITSSEALRVVLHGETPQAPEATGLDVSTPHDTPSEPPQPSPDADAPVEAPVKRPRTRRAR